MGFYLTADFASLIHCKKTLHFRQIFALNLSEISNMVVFPLNVKRPIHIISTLWVCASYNSFVKCQLYYALNILFSVRPLINYFKWANPNLLQKRDGDIWKWEPIFFRPTKNKSLVAHKKKGYDEKIAIYAKAGQETRNKPVVGDE